jgi:phosphoenolpyruvate-protein phosphotransferase (PTS system enzyme I)
MFPMITNLAELLQAKIALQEAKHELDREGISYSTTIEVGIMIEVPAAALISDTLARHVDFFSIGTNDLIQYTCAVDRMNPRISDLYDPCHPAVLRLIKMTIDNAHQHGVRVGTCGEMAGAPEHIPLLIGMGIDELSMNPVQILAARQQIRALSYETARQLARDVLD